MSDHSHFSFLIQLIVNGMIGSLGNAHKAVEEEHGLTPEQKMLPRNTEVNVIKLRKLKKAATFKNAQVTEVDFKRTQLISHVYLSSLNQTIAIMYKYFSRLLLGTMGA